jgi:hypothetical protein
MTIQDAQRLVVEFVLPGGVIYTRRMDDLPNVRLAADLVSALAAATHPHGPIRTRSVAEQYVTTMRRMVRELHAQDFAGGLTDLTSPILVRYWLTCDFHRERRVRAVLMAYQNKVGGLADPIVRHLAGRRINRIVKSRPNAPYSDTEWQRLTTTCVETISVAHGAYRSAIEAAERGADPAEHGVNRENLAWLLTGTGPLATTAVLARLPDREGVDRAELLELQRVLFPDTDTALAYLTLFAMRTGIVPDGIDALTVDDITHTSPSSVLLSYRKGRTGRESLNLPRDAVRLLDRWLKHSALLRKHAGPLADRLWIHTVADGRGRSRLLDRIFAEPRTQHRRAAFVRSVGVLGDDGKRLPLHGGRIRATYHLRRDRSTWIGRTTIDPNHSARVEGDHYLSSHTPAQLDAIEGVIEQAQHDLRRKAAPPVVVSGEDAAAFVAAFPGLVTAAGLDGAAIEALLGGAQDVFVAACADPLSSPHAPAGTLCPARPWVCLLCPLAAFAPRHLPNLLRLKEYFSDQGQRMTVEAFVRTFGPYAARLDEEILPRFGSAAIEVAARQITEAATLPLHLEEQLP